MNCTEIIDFLKSEASEKYKNNIVRLGIPENDCIGVSTATLRRLAKKLEKSNRLAYELWNSHFHEARLLAVFLFHEKELTFYDIDKLMSEVISWDLCDHLCKNLIINLANYEDYITSWITDNHVYKKRAAFTLIASAATHDKKISQESLDRYLNLIFENSTSDHDHIKKAVSWALREIGKIDFESNKKALLVAHKLLETGNREQIWIAKDVIKELKNVTKTDGRKRLISANSKMAQHL